MGSSSAGAVRIQLHHGCEPLSVSKMTSCVWVPLCVAVRQTHHGIEQSLIIAAAGDGLDVPVTDRVGISCSDKYIRSEGTVTFEPSQCARQMGEQEEITSRPEPSNWLV